MTKFFWVLCWPASYAVRVGLQVNGVVNLLSTHDEAEEYLATRMDEAAWTCREEDKQHWRR